MSIKGLLIGLVVVFSFLSIIFYAIVPNFMPFNSPSDVDYISNGEYAGCYLVSSIWGDIVIVDQSGNIKWKSHENYYFLHDSDILPNGNILMADTAKNRVIEVDIDDPSKILWSWDALNSTDINWTKFSLDQGWTDLSFLEGQSSLISSWTHLNDVDLINGSKFGRNFDSILISLNNFNLVIEVNYSVTKEIIWWYGQPSNLTILNHQHNPDRYDNGNTVICDTGNDRIIEVNTTTKKVVWELKLEFPYGKFRFARDCDDIGNNMRLITDSGNNRLLIYDLDSQKFVKEIKSPWLANPYDADMLNSGNIIVSNLFTDSILIIDYETGLVIGMIGFPHKWVVPYCMIGTVITYQTLRLIKTVKTSNKRKFRKILDFQIYRRIVYIILGILILYFFNAIINFLWFFTVRG
ncbi:MAG: aryl-sulfate sulfotransferase [Candidatus Hodarchaeota archaeon]